MGNVRLGDMIIFCACVALLFILVAGTANAIGARFRAGGEHGGRVVPALGW